MKIDANLIAPITDVPQVAAQLEAQGFDGVMTTEIASDPFFPLLLAAEHTVRLELMTSIALAFARNPMLMANIGNDLQAFSKGRFILGIGSQIKPHITKRFSMPWSDPAARMREFILALQAIWACWYEDKPLDFKGEYYTHTLMTPTFVPTNNPHGAPPVILAAVGPKMTEVAGEVADGMIVHPFNTVKYLKEVTLPAIERGLAAGNRDRSNFQICVPPFVVTGRTAEEWEKNRRRAAERLAFYGSTPAYKGVLEAHGWGHLQPELNAMSKRGEWVQMGEKITDEIIETFAVVAEPDKVADGLRERYEGLVDRVVCDFAELAEEDRPTAIKAVQQ